MGWLWLSGLMTAPEEQQTCLERVLQVNPANVYARAGLRQLQEACSTPVASVETDLLESRVVAAIHQSPTPPPVASPSNQAKPVIKRLKSYQRSSQSGPDKIEMANQAGLLEPSHSPTPTAPSPDLDPRFFATTCPACDYPISLTDSSSSKTLAPCGAQMTSSTSVSSVGRE